jgi:Mrp family chromosome partitioning ATPase
MISRLRLPAAAFCAALVLAAAAALVVPQSYVARARVLLPNALPDAPGESRVLKLEGNAADPSAALAQVRALLARHGEAQLIDPPSVLPARRDALSWAWGAALAGWMLGLAVVLRREYRRRPVRHERDLVAALGQPLLAAHPSGREAVDALARQLAAHWLVGGRRLLPLVDASAGEAAGAFAVALAHAFADLGARTLLIDADLRSPRLHARLGAPRGKGLADFLEGRRTQWAFLSDRKFAFLAAGQVRSDPLELLSRQRLRHLLDAAAQPFDVVLVHTAPVARGPDFEIFAALAGGALVFSGATTDAAQLGALKARLARCAARVIGTVLERP